MPPRSPAPLTANPPAPAVPPAREGTAWRLPSWPWWVAAGVLLAVTGYFVRRIVAGNDGHWEYPIDDAYGHLAVAKNLWRHGTWTFSAPNGFDSGDSSLAWPVLLALSFVVGGVNEYSSLVLNLLSCLGLLWYAAGMLRRAGASRWQTAATLLAVVVLTPLPLLACVGMEHCFHALASLVFVDLACRRLAAGSGNAPAPPLWALPVAALVLTSARYEGMFLVGTAAGLLACRGRWREALATGLAAALPIVAFGLFSLARGWAFLPCSVLLKGNRPESLAPAALWPYAWRAYTQLLDNPHMLFLVLALAVGLLVRFARGADLWSYPVLLLLLTLAGTLAHLQFAALGWFYRYEGYLLALGIVVLGASLVDLWPGRPLRGWSRPAAWPALAAGLVAVGLFVAPAWRRTVESCRSLVIASHNIYEQQYQMARFLHRFYEGQGVAANDVGNIAYHSDVRLCDFAGLINLEVMRRLRAHTFDQSTVRRLLARYDVRVIVVYDTWAGFYGGQLPEWGVPVGRWTIPGNHVCASETVSFYAPRPELAPALLRALREFAPSLPPDVVQDGRYRDTAPPHALGVYYPDFDAEGTFYGSSHFADFYLPPEAGWTAPSPDAALAVSVRPRTVGQTLEVSVNGQQVERRTFAAAEVDTWVPLVVRGPWKEGINQLSLVGQGSKVVPPNDNRPVLFMVREPRWTTRPTEGGGR